MLGAVHFRFGSFSTKQGSSSHVRFPLDSDRTADIAVGPVRANRRTEQGQHHRIDAGRHERSSDQR
jgi:hypothetical protein